MISAKTSRKFLLFSMAMGHAGLRFPYLPGEALRGFLSDYREHGVYSEPWHKVLFMNKLFAIISIILN